MPKSPPSSPPLSRLNNSELTLITRQRFSADFPTISVTPVVSEPEPPHPTDHAASQPPPPPSPSIADHPPSPFLPHAPSRISPVSNHSPSSTLSPIDETGPATLSPEDAGSGPTSAPTTPGSTRAKGRSHQRSGSSNNSDLNMKKISLNQLVESLTPVSTLPGEFLLS
jgi:hypothetical protein